MSIISENIKRVRTEKHMDQKDLADKLNVSNKTVSSWECGRTEPRMGMIEKLCQALGCRGCLKHPLHVVANTSNF